MWLRYKRTQRLYVVLQDGDHTYLNGDLAKTQSSQHLLAIFSLLTQENNIHDWKDWVEELLKNDPAGDLPQVL